MENKKDNSNDFTTGSVQKKLINFTIPIICGKLLMQLYNYTDSVIVGRFLGKEALAAVGASTPIVFSERSEAVNGCERFLPAR